MKKLIYCAAALATALFAGSCQQELLDNAAGETTVSYSVALPGASTKAIGNGTNVNQLVYEVWKVGEDGNITDLSTRLYQKTINVAPTAEKKWIVSLNLVQNQYYKVLFWAQVQKEAGFENYDTDELTNVHYAFDVTKAYSSNQEDYAAFYGTKNLSTFSTPQGETITLTRPFGQLNIGTTNNADETEYTVALSQSSVEVTVPTSFNVATSETDGETKVNFNLANVPTEVLPVSGTNYEYVAMNYVFAGSNSDVTYTIDTFMTPAGSTESTPATITKTIPNVPFKENYRTNIIGDLLRTSVAYEVVVDADFNDKDDAFEGGKYGIIDGQQYIKVENSADFTEAVANENVDIIILEGDINLNDIVTRSATDVTLTVNTGRTLTLDLNGKTLSATSKQTGKNYNMLDVRGNLTVKNGTIEYKHKGDNMGWGNSTNIFNVTAGGVLNLEGVTAKNHGGSDMGFVAHLNNWGEVTLNAENCILESNYVPVRVFNSGYDMNNVTIKNSSLKGNSAAFWVHNYTVEDFGSAEKAEAQKALLNLNIYDQGNTFSPDLNGVRYGFTNSVRSDAYGITKTVSEDGTEVTLGSVVENGLVRRGVAGAEENTTITKAIVGKGITTLYDRTFRRFYALETVELPDGLTTIGAAGSGVFQSCTALKNIVIPESVTVLGKGTFQECSSLESINIPAGVTRIEADALRATGLVSVEFHEGVTYFGTQAFRDCKQLTKVVIKAPEFTMEGNTFGIMAAPFTPMTIHVANAEMKAYVESKLGNNEKKYMTVIVGEYENYCKEEITNQEGVKYEGDAFESGAMDNTLWFNDYYFYGEAAIKVVDKTYGAIIIENCAGNFKNDVITIDNDNNSVMILQNLDLTLAEGKKLIKAANKIYQVFMANITINGEKMTQESIAEYLENVEWYQVVEEI